MEFTDPLFQQSPELKVSVEKIIHSLARRYSQYLSPTALFTKDDLVQEGWMVWWKLRTQRRYDPNRGQLTTLLYESVIKRFNSVMRYESQRCRRHERCETTDQLQLASKAAGADRYAMVFQALEALAELNCDIASLFTEGVPSDLLEAARVNNRIRCHKEGRSAIKAKITITPQMLRKYFKISLSSVQQLANHYL